MRFAHRVVVAGSAVVLTWGATLGVAPVAAQQSPFGTPASPPAAATSTPGAANPGEAAPADLQWLTNLDAALTQAAAQRKFVLVHFWDDNCAPCIAVEKNVFSRPEAKQAIQANFIAVKVKVSDQPEIAKKYRVDRWPTDVLLSADGRELYRTVTSQNPNQYVALLSRVATTARGSMAAVQDATKSANQWADRVANTIPQFGANPNGANPNSANANGNAPSGVSAAFAAAGNAFGGNQPSAPPPQTAEAPPAAPPPAAFVGNNAPASGGAFRPSAETAPVENRSTFIPGGAAAAPPPGPAPNQSAFAPTQFAPPPTPQSAAPPPAAPTNGGGFVPPATSPPPPAPAPSIAQSNAAPSNVAPPPTGQAPGVSNAAAPKSTGLGLEGFCPVTLQSTRKWRRGDARWGVVHRDRTYLFAGPDEQRLFLENPDKFAPMLSGYDPVRYAEQGQLVDGRRQHGVWYRNQMYLFADEVSLEKFWKNPDMVVPRVEQAMRATAGGGVRR